MALVQGRRFEHKSTQGSVRAGSGQANGRGAALQGRSLQHQHQTHVSSVCFEASFISSDAFGDAIGDRRDGFRPFFSRLRVDFAGAGATELLKLFVPVAICCGTLLISL